MSDYMKVSPRLRKYFNRLYVVIQSGISCGPFGKDVKEDGWYAVMPVFDLAHEENVEVWWFYENIPTDIPLGYFWMKCSEDPVITHHRYTFIHNKTGDWKPDDPNSPELPRVFNEASEAKRIEVSFLDDVPFNIKFLTV